MGVILRSQLENIEAELESLAKLSARQLDEGWQKLFGTVRPRRLYGLLLIGVLAYRLQEQALSALVNDLRGSRGHPDRSPGRRGGCRRYRDAIPTAAIVRGKMFRRGFAFAADSSDICGSCMQRHPVGWISEGTRNSGSVITTARIPIFFGAAVAGC